MSTTLSYQPRIADSSSIKQPAFICFRNEAWPAPRVPWAIMN